MITADALHRAGIEQSPEAFAEAVRRAIEMMPAAESRATSQAELTPADSAALERGGFVLDHIDYGADDPYIRGKATFAALVASGLSVAAVAAMLHVDESRVRQRLAKRTLYGIKLEGVWHLPTFQFVDRHLIPGLDVVLPALDPSLHPVTVYQWFTQPDDDLTIAGEPRSPREWLLYGEDAGVVAAIAGALGAPL
jgi:hypothetical protein